MGTGLRVTHLALQVRDPERSAGFYLDVIGLDAVVEPRDWGVHLACADGFSLALIRGEPAPIATIGQFHFGCALVDGAAVREARSRLSSLGHAVTWEEEPGYASVKLADPDGYTVELAYDA